jgi:two-component system response regulator FixJ
MTQPISGGRPVHVVDTDAPTRHAVTALLQSVQRPIESHDSAVEFLRTYEPHTGSCAIVEMRLPQISGLELLQRLARLDPELPVIMISAHGDAAAISQALKFGAVDFFAKPFSEQLLLERVQEVLASEPLHRQVADDRDQVRARLAVLTQRERQILALILAGYATKQIAARLGISYKTVENRRRHIHDKLHVDGLAQLVATVIPLLDGCNHAACDGSTPCSLLPSDRLPCRLNPPSAHTRDCPLADPQVSAGSVQPAVPFRQRMVG